MASDQTSAEQLIEDSKCLAHCIPSGLLGAAQLQATLNLANNPINIGTVTLSVSDIEIGAVELKDSTTNNRATINGAGELLVSGTFAMPAGAATEAKQDAGNASLASIDAKLANPMPVTGTLTGITNPVAVTGTFWQATQPVSIAGTVAISAASLPLPTGAATAALQTQPGVDIGDVTVNNAAGASAVNIQDGGNSITVDGTFFQATQPVSIAANVTVVGTGTFAVQATLAAETTKVIGTVNQGTSPWVTNDPGLPNALGQSTMAGSTSVVIASDQTAIPISGSITADIQGDYVDDSGFTVATDRGIIVGGVFTTDNIDSGDFGAFKINAKRELFVVQDTAANLNATVTGTVAATQSGTWTVTGAGGTFPVTGTFWQATQPVSIAANVTVVGTGTFVVQATLAAETTKVIGTVNQGTSPWVVSGTVTSTPSGTQTVAGNKTNNNAAPGATNVGALVAVANAAAPTQTEGNLVALRTNLAGDVAVTLDGEAVVLGAGSAVVGHVIADSGSTTVVTGTVAVTQSGTWTVQPGNTANTTAWKVDGSAVTQPVSGTFWQATQPVSIAANVTVVGTGTFAAQVTLAAGAASIGKAEDVASADADVGVPAMAVRKATPANTSGTDGDYEFLQMSAGRLWVDASGVTLTVASHAVTNAGTFAVQATVASGGIASGAIASGAVASGAIASGAIAAGAVAAGAYVSGSILSGALASGAVVDITNVSMPITPATATATKTLGLGAEYRSTLPTWTNTQQGALQVGTRGSLHVELWNSDSATANPSGSGTATGALRVELANNGTGTLATVTAVTTVSTVTSLTQMNGQAIAMGTGVRTAGTQRVTIATDDSVPVTGTLSLSGTVSTKTALTASSPTAASVGVVSAQAVAAAATRKGLILVNTSTATISLGFGSAAVLYSGVTLKPGYAYNMAECDFHVGAVNAIASAAASNLAIQEYLT